ncbi:MAG: mechanosensitive ion channel family protein [Pseudomonadota bacterium]|nr:mechanosensitive ion channel family protein [Pseudomonadota bacterium]
MEGLLLNLLIFGIAFALIATVVFSSSVIVSNILAGLILRALPKVRLGDHIELENFFGQVTKIDLLHVEIRTEDGALSHLPNFSLLTKPICVYRSSVNTVNLTVCLGYEKSRAEVERILIHAAESVSLESPFVQILELGDSLIRYRVSGSTSISNDLISVKDAMRAEVLDSLQRLDIGSKSPNSMVSNKSKPLVQENDSFISPEVNSDQNKLTEKLAKLKNEYTDLSQELIQIEQALQDAGPGEGRRPISLQKKSLEAKLVRIEKQITELEGSL